MSKPTKNLTGWLTRELDATVVVNVPEMHGLVAWCPEDLTERGRGLLKSMFQKHGRHFVESTHDDPGELAGLAVVVVGTARLKQLTELSMDTMRFKLGVWGPRGREWVGIIIDHPDSILHQKASDRERGQAKLLSTINMVGVMSDVQATGQGLTSRLGTECIKCREEHRGMIESVVVVEMTRQGLGLCRRHSGFDVRPQGQRFEQERLL